MFIDARTVPDGTSLETDVCIMGAGAAGITLAREFIGQNFRVHIFESGGLEQDDDTQSLYDGENVGIPYFPLNSCRLRYFGGTSGHWGGLCFPMRAIDLESRDWIPHSGWPLTVSDLDPYYERAQKVCHLPVPDWELSNWIKRERNPPLLLDSRRVTNRFALMVPELFLRFGTIYRDQVKAAENVSVYLHANVTEIETDPSVSRVSTVHLACLSGTKLSVKAKLFVLALGGIENPRLLLLSRRNQPAGLGNGADLVGRFFMEHPRFDAGIFVPNSQKVNVDFYEPHRVSGAPLVGYLSLADNVLREEKMVGVQARLNPIYDPAYMKAIASPEIASLKMIADSVQHRRSSGDLGMHVSSVLEDLNTWKANFIPTAPVPLPKPSVVEKWIRARPESARQFVSDLLGDLMYAAYTSLGSGKRVEQVTLATRIDQAPNPDSRVSLTSERDQLGLNRVQLDWRLSPIDIESADRFLEILALEMGQKDIGRVQNQLSEDHSIPSDTHGGYHHIGTTRMADDPREGVVDRNCSVHGISNLFVAGSSVFPTAGSGTPTLTLVALALRMADQIKEKFR
jgi:choline dehydrogenase-like flavoprotein